eukprot:g13597.t1
MAFVAVGPASNLSPWTTLSAARISLLSERPTLGSGRGEHSLPVASLPERLPGDTSVRTAGTTSGVGGGVLHRDDRYEETNSRRRIAKVRREAWKAVLQDLDGAETAAAEARAVEVGLDAGALAIGDRGVSGGGVGGAVDACGRAGKWREAAGLIEEMQTEAGITPNAMTYNAAIAACRKGNQPKKVMALLEEMKVRGIAPNAASFSVAMSSLGDAGHSKGPVALFREMDRAGVELEAMCSTAVLSACAGGNKPASQRRNGAAGGGGTAAAMAAGAPVTNNPPWEDARAILREMSASGLEPNLFHFNATVSACAAFGRWRNGNNMERASELKKDVAARGIKGGGALMASLLSEVQYVKMYSISTELAVSADC